MAAAPSPKVNGDDEHANDDQADGSAVASTPACLGRSGRVGGGCYRRRRRLPARGQLVTSPDLMEPGAEQRRQLMQVGVVMLVAVTLSGLHTPR